LVYFAHGARKILFAKNLTKQLALMNTYSQVAAELWIRGEGTRNSTASRMFLVPVYLAFTGCILFHSATITVFIYSGLQ
jgi:hypothetical protein